MNDQSAPLPVALAAVLVHRPSVSERVLVPMRRLLFLWLYLRKGAELEVTPYFNQMCHGKQSVTLDLKKPEARQVLMDLAAGADVIVENMRPPSSTCSERGNGIGRSMRSWRWVMRRSNATRRVPSSAGS